MDDKKYYVKLKPSISVIVEYDDQDNDIAFGYGYLNGLHEFSPWTSGNTFTKSELAEFMNGAFYKLSSEKCDYCRYSGGDTCGDENCEEWINPLIELVPVEDDD